MVEEDLVQLGFERVDVSEGESGDKPFHYYTYDIGNGTISLISQSNDEVEDNYWHVEVFDDTSIRFETIEDVTKFIQVTEKNIVHHSTCKHIKQIGSSCSLNNNCKYPNCNELTQLNK